MSLEEREQMIVMIKQAREEGARLAPACDTVEIDPGTYRRWQHAGQVVADRRATAPRPEPHNKLSAQEREQVLLTSHQPEFKSLPPSQIVPTLADRGEYLASGRASIGCYERRTSSMIVGAQSRDRKEPSRTNIRHGVRTSAGLGTSPG